MKHTQKKLSPANVEARLFAGVFPCGIVYADRGREVSGDYARLGFLDYGTLTLILEKNCPVEFAEAIRADAAEIQAKKGQDFRISTVGQVVRLGHELLEDEDATTTV